MTTIIILIAVIVVLRLLIWFDDEFGRMGHH
jgi:hypothetical protein